ncbi:MAG: phosphatidylethanolamine-binding protein [Myxococcales bacterium]|nr:phosphatidylethanolamine-binding protein [Myxococcales bacterium]
MLAVLSLVIMSGQFTANGSIPVAHTCEGADTAPSLHWLGVPPTAKSLALVVDDPDAPDPKAPKKTFVHWVLYNLPPTATALPAGATRAQLPPGTREANNDHQVLGWRGPCPPVGRHRYFFKLYALDTVLPDLGAAADKAMVVAAMKGHIVAEGQLVGTYEKLSK